MGELEDAVRLELWREARGLVDNLLWDLRRLADQTEATPFPIVPDAVWARRNIEGLERVLNTLSCECDRPGANPHAMLVMLAKMLKRAEAADAADS